MTRTPLPAALALLASTALFSVAAPAAANEPMTPVDLATFSRVAAPAVSPDGAWVIYQQTETDRTSFVRTTGLYIVSAAAGAIPVRIADLADANESAPAFSPDGRRLYFLSNKSGKSQLWFVERGTAAAGGGGGGASWSDPAQASDLAADVAGFRISPNGQRILLWGDIAVGCASFGCTGNGDLATQGGGSGRTYNEIFVRHWDAWETPGVHSRAFTFALGSDGRLSGDAAAIAPELTGDTPSKPFGGGEELAWSADSATVFFTLRIADRNEPLSTDLDIYTAPASGGTATNLTDGNAATDTLPTPSPDGRWLAYAAMARPGYEADRQVLMLRDLRTGTVRALTEGWDRSVGSIAWTPDSRRLIVTAQDVLDHPAFSVDRRTGQVTRLTLSPGSDAEGTINDVTALSNGRLVYSRNSVTQPTDIWMRAANGDRINLSAANATRTANLWGAEVQRFSFAGAGGETVWGQIVLPGEGQHARMPTVLLVHGGPQGSFGNGWSTRWNPAVFAQAGYAVVTIDFHGSTGYGQAFTDSINRDWGGKPLEDLRLGMAAAAAASPMVDPANACAAGGSYGGYMMNWIAGNWPDGFKCLVNHAGIFDLRAMAFETEELWFDEWDHGGPWWSRDPAQRERWNPVNQVTNWRTPMLVIHGEKDFRIPYSQSLAAFTALQRQGIPSQLLIFPDENHWVLKGRNSVQWYSTVVDWMRRWTGPQPIMGEGAAAPAGE